MDCLQTLLQQMPTILFVTLLMLNCNANFENTAKFIVNTAQGGTVFIDQQYMGELIPVGVVKNANPLASIYGLGISGTAISKSTSNTGQLTKVPLAIAEQG